MSENTPSGSTNLTPLGKLLTFGFIVALLAVGAYMVYTKYAPDSVKAKLAVDKPPVELADTKGITTVQSYSYVPADKLPAVKGTSNYKWDNEKKILRFSYNVWAGWLPVIAANHGTEPNDESVFFKKYGFRVQMVLMDDPVMARDAFAAGDVHTLWGTADMMVLFAPALSKDSRTSPRIVQQIDWSSGGDGIVVRSTVKNVGDLKGKTIALAPNSPSEYYLTSLLLSAGINPKDVTVKHTATAFEAAAAFVADKSIDGCVSWSPDIYNITKNVANTRILSSSADANKLIADVYALRADFARDHADVVNGLVAGIFEGMDMVKKDPAPACQWMADAFKMPKDDVMGMRNDFHSTNFAENVQFFLNASNPTNFERTWKNASYVYGELDRLDKIVPFDQVMDFGVIKSLEAKGMFADQRDESIATFTPGTYKKGKAEAVITQTIRINFYPNSANPYEPAHDEYDVAIAGKLYDPNVSATMDRVARLSGQFARAVVLIQGHTDSSMKGRVPVQAVRDLSLARAEAIKQALIQKYKFPADKFTVEGKGWDEPADPNDPDNQPMNRRVEISVFPPEQQ
jgi:NitT/TauT family transport system substrate-binding protein